jgi:hypothetical protein
VFNGNLQQAVDKFYSSDRTTLHKLIDGSTPIWDESAFGASRYADDTNSNVPSMLAPYSGTCHGETSADELCCSLQY